MNSPSGGTLPPFNPTDQQEKSRSLKNQIKYLIWDTKHSLGQLKDAVATREAARAKNKNTHYPSTQRQPQVAEEEEEVEEETVHFLGPISAHENKDTANMDHVNINILDMKFQQILKDLNSAGLAIDTDEIEAGPSTDLNNSDNSHRNNNIELPLINVELPRPRAKSESGVLTPTKTEVRAKKVLKSTRSLRQSSPAAFSRRKDAKKFLAQLQKKSDSTATIRQTAGAWKRRRCMIPIVFVGILFFGCFIVAMIILYMIKSK